MYTMFMVVKFENGGIIDYTDKISYYPQKE